MTHNIQEISLTTMVFTAHDLGADKRDEQCPTFDPLVKLFSYMLGHSFYGKEAPITCLHTFSTGQTLECTKEYSGVHSCIATSFHWRDTSPGAVFGSFRITNAGGVLEFCLYKNDQWRHQKQEDKERYPNFSSSVSGWHLFKRYKWVTSLLMATVLPLITEQLLDEMLDGHSDKKAVQVGIDQLIKATQPLIDQYLP